MMHAASCTSITVSVGRSAHGVDVTTGQGSRWRLEVFALDQLKEALWAAWALVTICGIALTLWLLIHSRKLTSAALTRLEKLESTAREDRVALGGALSAATHTLGRLVGKMNRFEASIMELQQTEPRGNAGNQTHDDRAPDPVH